jgi:hypothetical protein
MPSVNPPVDYDQAGVDPELVLSRDAMVVRVGRRRDCDTQPEPSAFRFVIVRDAGGQVFAGYLWEIGPAGEPATTRR